ncbi:hypothetical protein C6N75_10195 [Streptomyces solincola]|uniref:SUKH-4 immunity protein of toxin-antitoxin system n=1 Tax=Streptomyces solincola TaxID=2100817 RepID=A0A2S9PXZ4_9ACTN|nr:nucleic acid/nucleotide deaminase domain-containing protein [Streptomyces solincola]PRH79291.1 hypothetical protein C6N75_10195 [Streptomyces solincola]
MSAPVPDPTVDHFGPGGMRRFEVTSPLGITLPSPSRLYLEEVGVPLHVGPYFTSAKQSDSLPLGVFAEHSGMPRPASGAETWLRIGTDGLAQVCVRPDGAVQVVLPGFEEPDMFASSDVRLFGSALAVLDRRMSVIAASTSLPVAAAGFRELNAELRQMDPEAFVERESWWPRVLDDVRHTLNFPFSAAFEYLDASGRKQVATEATGPGRAHPEELLWQRLAAEGVRPQQVRKVYCELEPCMMPGHYCAVWLQSTFPQAEFTHSFDYGSDAQSREDGLKGLITSAAQQARNQ